MSKPCFVVWTDSSSYGSTGKLLEDDDLEGYDKHKVYSQAGALLGLIEEDDLENLSDIKMSLLDWRPYRLQSRSSKKVVHATFVAESMAAFEAVGMVTYLSILLSRHAGPL